MSADELTAQSVVELARLMRARLVSPVEVVEAYLRRIDNLNPQLNAIVTLAPDALERAREAENKIMRRSSDDDIGALCGVPITIKDTIETKGLLTTSGSRVRATHVPARNATAVARLKAAGAIIIGKTNASEMAMAYDADNHVFGRTNNPHDLERSPGGSSGGCAAAVGACLVPASIGSDLAGSIRVPAHFCGVLGLKPTNKSVPLDGHFPIATKAFAHGASFGPLARYVRDLSLLYRVLAENATQIDSSESVATVQAKQRNELHGKRVAWYAYDGVSVVTDETREAVLAAARALGQAGMIAFEAQPPGVTRAPDLWSELFQQTALDDLRKLYSGREDDTGAFVRAVLSSRSNATPKPHAPEKLFAAQREQTALRETLLEWMKQTPLIIAPVGAVPAYPHDTRRVTVGDSSQSVFRCFSYAQTYNVFGLPCVSIPAGRTRENLPVGVQIIGRPFMEEEVLAAAAIIEEALGGWQPPANLSA
ncbi:MAG: amidase [Pyrinomonadaceae bacterium]